MTSLTGEQLAFVRSSARARRLIAGPGTGKTTTIAHAVADRINSGAPPHQTTVVTFSRAAAQHARAKIAELLDEPERVRGIFCGTVHQLALQVLRTSTAAKRVTIWTHDDEMRVAREVLRETTGTSAVSPSRVRSAYREIASDPDRVTPKVRRAAEEYARRKQRAGAIHFDEIVARAGDAAVSEVRAAWRDHMRDVYVDEAQDLRLDEAALVQRMMPIDASIAWIGDPRQAIHGWRGAWDMMAATEVVKETFYLTRSFRCPDEVLAAAAAFDCVGVPMNGRDRRAKPCVAGVVESHLTLFLFTHVQVFGEAAILCRTNHEVRRITEYLRANRIPCHVIGATLPDHVVAELESLDTDRAADSLDIPGARSFARSVGALTVGEIIDACSGGSEPNGIAVGTIHAAKGREWDQVILRCDRGFPSKVAGADQAEERRIFYVGATRARRDLFLWAESEESRSPFIDESLAGDRDR